MAVIEGAATTVNSGSPLMAGIGKKKKRSAIDLYKEASSKSINIKPSKRGSLHTALGVPQGSKIPASKLSSALNSPNPNLRKKAQFAKNAKSFKH